jgi:hypothetical protein
MAMIARVTYTNNLLALWEGFSEQTT